MALKDIIKYYRFSINVFVVFLNHLYKDEEQIRRILYKSLNSDYLSNSITLTLKYIKLCIKLCWF